MELHRIFRAKFWSGSDLGCGELVIPLDLFSLLGVGIYNQFFTSQSGELVKLAESQFESAEWGIGFENTLGRRRS